MVDGGWWMVDGGCMYGWVELPLLTVMDFVQKIASRVCGVISAEGTRGMGGWREGGVDGWRIRVVCDMCIPRVR